MKFLNALLSDLPLKVLSLVLAFVVWHVVRQGLDAEPVLDFRVVTSVGEESNLQARLVSPTNGRVSVKLKGPRQQVAQLSAMSDRIVIARVPEGTPGPNDWEAPVSLALQDLTFPALDDLEALRAVGMSPTEVKLNVERIETKTLTVFKPVLEAGDAPEHVTIEVLIPPPEEITVRGTKELLDKLVSVEPIIPQRQLAQHILSMEDRTEREFPVQLDIPGLGTDFELVGDGPIEATIRITARKTVSVWVPIRAVFRVGEPLIHLEGHKDWWRPEDDGEPAQILLSFTGPPARVDALDGATLQAIVITGDLPDAVLAERFGTVKPEILWANVPKKIRDAVEPVYEDFPSVAVTVEK